MKKITFFLIAACIALNVNSQITVYSNSNVGVKTATIPIESLEVNGNVKATSFIGDGSKITGLPVPGGSQWVLSGLNLYYTIGKVGIGTITPNEALEINGNIRGNLSGGALNINTAANGYLQIGPQNSSYCHIYTDRPMCLFNKTVLSLAGDFGSYYTNDLIFKTGVSYYNTAGTVRMTINNSTGYVGINNVSPTCALDVTGVIKSNTVVVTSDARLKENVKNMTGSLAYLTNLQGVTYKFKADLFKSYAVKTKSTGTMQDSAFHATPQNIGDTTLINRSHIGFLAQDIQKVFPELVYADKEGILSVDYISLIPVLVESLKEVNKKVDALIIENAILKKKLGIH